MACPTCASERTIKIGSGRAKCLDPAHTGGPRTFNADRTFTDAQSQEAANAVRLSTCSSSVAGIKAITPMSMRSATCRTC
jgi:hypothetical protein